MKIRPYQEEMIERVYQSFQSGYSSPCIVLPTGSGKTATVLAYLTRHEPGQILWMAPRVSLIDQTWRAVRRFAPELESRLTICTVQSLLAGNRPLPKANVCVVDEAHFFYGTKEWGAVAHAFPRRIAATATPTRADYQPLKELCDVLLAGPQRRQLVADGFLPPMRTIAPEKRRKTAARTVVDAYRDHCVSGSQNERCLVFCANVAHAQQARDDFVLAGIRAGSVTIDSGADLGLHAAGLLDVLTNVYMVAVGYDDPTVTSVILARPFASPTSMIQACGRARGASSPEVKVIDLFGSCHEWGLADEDRIFSLGDDPIRLSPGTRERELVVCRECKSLYRLNAMDLRCPRCGMTERSPTKKERNREILLAKRAADTDDTKFKFLQKTTFIVRHKRLPAWIPIFQYKKRYGGRPPVEWLEKLGLRARESD